MLRDLVVAAGAPVFYVYHLSDRSDDYVYEMMVPVAERLWSKTWHRVAATEGMHAAYKAVDGTHTKWYEIAGPLARFELLN
jgi:hypothetical protein